MLLPTVPLLIGSGLILTYFLSFEAKAAQDAYAKAGNLAEQAISAIRTVVAFGGESCEIRKYEEELKLGFSKGMRRAIITGMGIGFIVFSICKFIYVFKCFRCNICIGILVWNEISC